jgi:TPP-dependent pyruvate/acetoin dehydrogenase alpha subunit
LHFKYYRYYQHVGVDFDFHHGYRPESEFKKWQARDPITLMRKKLRIEGHKEEVIAQAEEKIQRQVNESLARAQAAPFPASEELYTDVYA